MLAIKNASWIYRINSKPNPFERRVQELGSWRQRHLTGIVFMWLRHFISFHRVALCVFMLGDNVFENSSSHLSCSGKEERNPLFWPDLPVGRPLISLLDLDCLLCNNKHSNIEIHCYCSETVFIVQVYFSPLFIFSMDEIYSFLWASDDRHLKADHSP
jgi:hypothetical protein